MDYMKYHFEIHISQYDLFMEHIITGIYGSLESDCLVRYIGNTMCTIDLDVDHDIPLINSLPKTIIQDIDIVYCDNKQLVDAVWNKISSALSDCCSSIGTYYHESTPIKLSQEDLRPIILQLARERKVAKFIELNDGKFLIYVNDVCTIALVKVINGEFVISIYSRLESMFDVDDGYDGYLEQLNPAWIKWRENGDITAPIHLPNVI